MKPSWLMTECCRGLNVRNMRICGGSIWRYHPNRPLTFWSALRNETHRVPNSDSLNLPFMIDVLKKRPEICEFWIIPSSVMSYFLFSRGVGMNRRLRFLGNYCKNVPHERGDEPGTPAININPAKYFPRVIKNESVHFLNEEEP